MLPRSWVRASRIATLTYIAVLACGLAGYRYHRSPMRTPRYNGDGPAASLAGGLRVVASSYDPFGSHHPLFAVDGNTASGLYWQPFREDASPSLELEFAAPATVSAAEFHGANLGTIRATCRLEAGKTRFTQTESRRVDLACEGALGVLFEFTSSTVRVSEIELSGGSDT